jgi:hypothetical protein
MNVDQILETMNRNGVAFLLIGGVNFLLRHAPAVTYDVDLWIDDTAENRGRCESALAELQAEWGPSVDDWGPVADKNPGWLSGQSIFCLLSPHGAIDIFRGVAGLESWPECRGRAVSLCTGKGAAVTCLSDEDMLQCQLALPENERKHDRVQSLRKAIGEGKT